MVDNVDKQVWITHTVFVHNAETGEHLLCGKGTKRKAFLQEILPTFHRNAVIV